MKIYQQDHNQVLADLDFETTEDVTQADRLVFWNDLAPINRGIIHYAKVPSFVMQHGRRGSSRYFPPFNEQITADKLLVWGENDKTALVEAGHDPKKIIVTGTTVFDHLKEKKEHEGINVVFCPEHWDRPVEENRLVRDELRKMKDVNIITKTIESHDPQDFDNVVASHRDKPDHLDICAEVLSTADLVVGVSESTFELLAPAMDIPVVIMTDWEPKSFGGDERYKDNYRRVVSNGSKHATIKTLLKVIRQQLDNPGELKEERSQIAIGDGGINLNAKEQIRLAISK